MKSQFEIIVSGRVQGVGFRAAARKQARALQLKGWVENLPNGAVRAVIAGETQNCSHFANWCREGSAYSWVEKVEVKEMQAESLGPFSVRY